MKLLVTHLQKFSLHDGPGIRTTVFLKGCPLRCLWCHNPETQSAHNQIFYHSQSCIQCMACTHVCPNGAHIVQDGEHHFMAEKCVGCMCCVSACVSGAIEPVARVMEISEIVALCKQDKPFYGQNGGVTLSGGEPMYQEKSCVALLAALKQEGIHTCLETCGYFNFAALPKLNELVDLFYWDVKDTDPERHWRHTGVDNAIIFHNLLQADKLGIPIVLRCILVEGINLCEEHAVALCHLYRRLKNAQRIDLLCCHSLGQAKAKLLGQKSNISHNWIPKDTSLRLFEQILLQEGIPYRLERHS